MQHAAARMKPEKIFMYVHGRINLNRSHGSILGRKRPVVEILNFFTS